MRLKPVHCGFLPLVDSAPLIIAQELNFAAQEGLDLTLAR
jgi:NitT/TauT family transport system ATP-binding protein